jgi:4-oxalocrotonate tautomerase
MTSTLQKGLSYSTFVIPFNMPLIAISLYPGRTREQKEAFAKAITNAAAEILKTKPEDVIITYDERSKENWYISGEPF